MNTYIFILGRNAPLSRAEILAVVKDLQEKFYCEDYLVVESPYIDCKRIMKQLGGTIKIAEVIGDTYNSDIVAQDLIKEKKEGKVVFGISQYGDTGKGKRKEETKKLGMETKKIMKEKGVNSRFVVSREPVLSSVVVQKNKCQEFIIFDGGYAKTCAIQEFEAYSHRDYGRPARDAVSGMIPLKLAKIMINLSQSNRSDILLDPFCGSGTILQEALLLEYKNIIGSDNSKKAIKDTTKNLEWLGKSCKLINEDVRTVFQKVKEVDAIITEPYLGPPLKGNESRKQLEKIINDVSTLYTQAFGAFKKILKPGGKVVIVFPVFNHKDKQLKLAIKNSIKKFGFQQLNKKELIYSRPNQKVNREIFVFEKSS